MSEDLLKRQLPSFFLMFLCTVILNMNCQDELTSIQFSTDFESGAATNFHIRSDGAIGFSISDEPGGDVAEYPAGTIPGEYLWFYFTAISDGKKPLDFVVDNAFGAHQTGWRWKITKPVFSADGRTWVRAKNTSYSYLRHRLWARGIKLLGKPVFRFQAPITAETLWVAYSYPYASSKLVEFFEEVRTYSDVTISTIGKSEENRDILRLDISGSAQMAGRKLGKIWIVCREHPGETPASYVCEGMIHALLKNPEGERLREVYSFSFVPMLNVDGVAHGHYYHNANGINLSFDWEDFAAVETRSLLDAMRPDIEAGLMRLMIDLHSSNDPTKGHYLLTMNETGLKAKDIEFQRDILKAVNGIHPQLQGHSPVMMWNVPSITGNALYHRHGVYCLYLETSYDRGADGSAVTPESLRETGAALVEALAQVLVSKQ